MDNWQEFEEGSFTEEEFKILKRMLPAGIYARAKKLSRRDFFSEARAVFPSVQKIVGPLQMTCFRMLSKRQESPGPLSRRVIQKIPHSD